MNPRRVLLMGRLAATIALFLLLSTLPAGAAPLSGTDPGGLQPTVLDNAVHDVGEVWLNVTNQGLLGAGPGGIYAGLPSLRFPGEGGDDLLYSAGVWIGGVLLGEQLVSTGQYAREVQAPEDPLDVIYATAFGAPGGNRYPYPDPDDDGDGLEDEDPLNGRDDDGDGLIDEDFAAISDQDYRCLMVDNTVAAQELYPDHTPLNIEVVQRSYAWGSDPVDGFVGFEITVRNIGVTPLQAMYLGLFADFDLPAGTGGTPGDDAAGYWNGMVGAWDGSLVHVELGYMRDGGLYDPPPLGTYAGVVLLDHPVDPTGQSAPPSVGMRSCRAFSGLLSFDQGGDPTNDAERYEALSSGVISGDTPPGHEGDYRVLVSCGPFAELAPGEELTYAFALVVGPGLEGLKMNAAEAVRTYQGLRFDRDGDPETGPGGKEFVVHWLSPQQIVVPAASGSLAARRTDQGVVLDIDARHAAAADLMVERRSGSDGTTLSWEVASLPDVIETELGTRATLVDTQGDGSEVRYALLHRGGGGQSVLAETELPGLPADLQLVAQPNPFNPRIDLSFRLSEAGPVRLEIFSPRGERIRTLLCESRLAGEHHVPWNGDDEAGAAVASGVYMVHLEAPEGSQQRRITLLR
jgi:hypothetical protein